MFRFSLLKIRYQKTPYLEFVVEYLVMSYLPGVIIFSNVRFDIICKYFLLEIGTCLDYNKESGKIIVGCSSGSVQVYLYLH